MWLIKKIEKYFKDLNDAYEKEKQEKQQAREEARRKLTEHARVDYDDPCEKCGSHKTRYAKYVESGTKKKIEFRWTTWTSSDGDCRSICTIDRIRLTDKEHIAKICDPCGFYWAAKPKSEGENE